MGESKAVICRDCEKFAHIGKIHIPPFSWDGNRLEDWYDEDWKQNRVKKMLTFMRKHKGHNLALTGEYTETQDEYFSTLDMEEFELGYE